MTDLAAYAQLSGSKLSRRIGFMPVPVAQPSTMRLTRISVDVHRQIVNSATRARYFFFRLQIFIRLRPLTSIGPPRLSTYIQRGHVKSTARKAIEEIIPIETIQEFFIETQSITLDSISIHP